MNKPNDDSTIPNKIIVKITGDNTNPNFLQKLKDKLDKQDYKSNWGSEANLPGYLEIPSFRYFETKQQMRRSKLDSLLSLDRIDDIEPTDARRWLKFFGLSRIDGYPIFEIERHNLDKDEHILEYVQDIFEGEEIVVQLVSCLEDHLPWIYSTGNIGFGTPFPSEKLHVVGKPISISGKVKQSRNIKI